MAPYYICVLSAALLVVMPIEQPWFLTWMMANAGFELGRVVIPLLLAATILVCLQSATSMRMKANNMPPQASLAFTWFTVHGDLTRDLHCVGVDGREVALTLYEEATRAWRLWVIGMGFIFSAAIIGIAWSVAMMLPGGEVLAIATCLLPLLLSIFLYTNLMLRAIGLLELDSRYYAWMKVAEYRRYSTRSLLVGGAVGIAFMGLIMPGIIAIRFSLSSLLGLTITGNDDPAVYQGYANHALMGGIILLILWPFARQFSAMLLRRRIQRMADYFPRLCDHLENLPR